MASPLRHCLWIVVRPRATWRTIAAERWSFASLAFGYVMPLAALGAVATFARDAFVGQRFGYVVVRVSRADALVQAAFALGFSLAAVALVTLVVEMLAPAFGARRDVSKAFRVAAFGSTPVWLAAVLVLLPRLWPLQVVAVAGEIFLLYSGLAAVMDVPPRRALGLAACAVAGAIGVAFGVGELFAAVAASGA